MKKTFITGNQYNHEVTAQGAEFLDLKTTFIDALPLLPANAYYGKMSIRYEVVQGTIAMVPNGSYDGLLSVAYAKETNAIVTTLAPFILPTIEPSGGSVAFIAPTSVNDKDFGELQGRKVVLANLGSEEPYTAGNAVYNFKIDFTIHLFGKTDGDVLEIDGF